MQQMIGMQYTNNFQAKGVLEVNRFTSSISSSSSEAKCKKDGSFAGNEPVSVLDTRSPSPSTSTSTLSSSFGDTNSRGNGDNTTNPVVGSEKGNPKGAVSASGPSTAAAAGEGAGGPKEEWVAEMQDIPSGLELSQVVPEKFNLGLEDWESLLSESAGQEQSLIRWISSDAEESSLNMKQLLQGGNSNEIQGNVGYGGVDQSCGFEALATGGSASGGDMLTSSNSSALGFSGSGFSLASNNGKLDTASNSMGLSYSYGNPQNQNLSSSPNNSFCLPPGLSVAHQQQVQCVTAEQKSQIFNPQSTMNQLQVQNAPNLHLLNSLLFGIHEDQPQPKRHNPGIVNPSSVSQIPKVPFIEPGNEFLLRKQQFPQMQHLQLGFGQQLNLLPSHNPQQKPLVVPKQEKFEGNGNPMLSLHHQQQQQQQQVVYDQIYKATELILAGNFSHAQGILARLNHLLSPVVKPFQRAAFYFKEALQLSFQMPNSAISPGLRIPTPFDGMFKMGAYKMLSEVSPLVQFMNFTSNQALLEALDNAEKIHIVDFDIGIGAQWSSFMQELPRRNKGAVSLKITAFASPLTHHSFDISLMHESLSQFANDVGVCFELEVVNFDSFDPSAYAVSSFRSSENEVIAVNFPIWSIASRPSMLPSLLCFLKQLSPKVVVLLDRGCERFDLPPTHHLLHALQYYEVLLDSIDAVNMAADAVNKIEKFLFQPRIESIVSGRLHSPNQMPTWTNLFASAGFSSVPLSNLSEAQAECMVKRTQVRGFHVEKRQASLVLCWQRRELLSASVWRF